MIRAIRYSPYQSLLKPTKCNHGPARLSSRLSSCLSREGGGGGGGGAVRRTAMKKSNSKINNNCRSVSNSTKRRPFLSSFNTISRSNSAFSIFSKKPNKINRKPRNIRNKSSASFSVTSWFDKLYSFILTPRVLPLPRWISPRYTSVTISEVFGHGSFVLVAISYAVNDFLMLRVLAVIGSSCALVFTYFHPHGKPLWLPFKWNILFIAINLYRIVRVLQAEYNAKSMPKEILDIHDEFFSLMPLTDFANFASCGKIKNYKPGHVIIEQGKMNDIVRFVISGKFDVYRDDQLTYHVIAGDFMSEAGLHAGLMLEGAVETSCTVVSDTPVKVIEWNRTELMELLKKHKGLRSALKSVLSWDIIHKLKNQRQILISHEINDLENWTIKRDEQGENRYRAILNNILSNHGGELDGHKTELENYRLIHNIDDDEHNRALSKCGWTLEEYELGYRIRNTEDDPFSGQFAETMRNVVERLFPSA